MVLAELLGESEICGPFGLQVGPSQLAFQVAIQRSSYLYKSFLVCHFPCSRAVEAVAMFPHMFEIGGGCPGRRRCPFLASLSHHVTVLMTTRTLSGLRQQANAGPSQHPSARCTDNISLTLSLVHACFSFRLISLYSLPFSFRLGSSPELRQLSSAAGDIPTNDCCGL